MASYKYKFNLENKDKYLKLIEKYFKDSKVSIKINNIKIKTFADVAAMSEAISMIQNPTGGIVVKIWSRISKPFIKTLPVLSDQQIEEMIQSYSIDEELAQKIYENVLFRSTSTQSIFCCIEHEISKQAVPAYAAYVLKKLGKNTMFYCPSVGRAYIPANDEWLTVIDTKRSGDVAGEIGFDFDEGFVNQYQDVPKEFASAFKKWVDNGKNPEDSVLSMSL